MDILQLLTRHYPRKRAFITGAGSGLGLALARRLADAGWSLGLNDREELPLLVLAGAYNPQKVTPYCFDVTNEAVFKEAADDFLARWEGIDLVFNCAGIGGGGSFLTFPMAYWREIIDINLLGVVHGTQLFLPAMLAAHQGRIVNIASAAAFHGLPRLSAYAASKAAVLAFSEVVQAELRGTGVSLSVKMSTFYRDSQIGRFTLGTADDQQLARQLVDRGPITAREAAEELLRQVADGRFYIVLPRSARFIWAFKRHLPGLYLRFIGRFGPRLVDRLRRSSRTNPPAHS